MKPSKRRLHETEPPPGGGPRLITPEVIGEVRTRIREDGCCIIRVNGTTYTIDDAAEFGPMGFAYRGAEKTEYLVNFGEALRVEILDGAPGAGRDPHPHSHRPSRN